VRPALAYRPGDSPLHRASPAAAISYLAALAAVGFVFASPAVLVAAGIALALAGIAAGASRAVAASLRLAVPLIVLMVVVNALVTHRGDTVLVRGWELPILGQMDLTLESLAEGGRIGLLVAVAVLGFAVYSACIDPDGVLRALRPVARRSAMTAGLVTRMVPLAVADGARLREAAGLRGPAAAPVGRAELARRLVESSLDRAVDVAATLELRGHSLDSRPQRERQASRDDAPLIGTTVLIAIAAIAAGLAGGGGFETYPRIEVDAGPATLTLCAGLVLFAAIPFVRAKIKRVALPRTLASARPVRWWRWRARA
jgi:energy-coupling factor transport system permease protein